MVNAPNILEKYITVCKMFLAPWKAEQLVPKRDSLLAFAFQRALTVAG